MMRSLNGFTLVEMVVVVGVISLLGTASVATYVEYRNQVDFATTEGELLQLVETAKQQARTGVGDASWSLELETDRLTLFVGTDFGTRDQSFDRVLLLPSDTSLTGPDTLTFALVTGYPDMAAVYALRSDDNEVVITINAYGTITMQ